MDIGTTKICAIVAEVAEEGAVNIIGVGSSPSRGLRKGVVVNIESTVESIKKAVEEAELMAAVQINSVYTGIAGSHISGKNSRGVVALKKQEVTRQDVERAIETARTVAVLPQDRRILHVLPREFMVDDQDGIREPLGMSGTRLEVDVHIITGAVTSAQNIIKSVNRAGLDVVDIVLQPLASSEAVLSPEEKELGVAMVDLGGGTTDLAVITVTGPKGGTGKTTVAMRMAEILHRLGYSRKGHLVTVTRDDLVGQYIGHTAPKTKEVLKRAMGGVLFIDEAYYLHRPENERDYGQEAIEILLQVMENHRDDLVVILAGYKDRMDVFFQSNPGMKSRIAHHIDFPDFEEGELMRIAELMLEKLMYRFSEEARQAFADYLRRRMAQPQFANARSVRNAIDRMRLRQGG
ncbi:MAG: cell division protein FtsA, partial [Nitrospiraceae bacterium]